MISKSKLVVFFGMVIVRCSLAAVQVSVDFSASGYYPLMKEKAGIYNEPHHGVFQYVRDGCPGLEETQIRYFRQLVTMDHQFLFPISVREDGQYSVRKSNFMSHYGDVGRRLNMIPILTLYGPPQDMLEGKGLEYLVKVPYDVPLYAEAVSDYTALYKDHTPIWWEIWNEPNAEVYLTAADNTKAYWLIYKHLATRIAEKNPDAVLIGPAINRAGLYLMEHFLQQVKQERQKGKTIPLDYISFHYYGRFKDRSHVEVDTEDLSRWVEDVRYAAKDGFERSPFMLTEFEHLPAGIPGTGSLEVHHQRIRTRGAVNFLKDLKYFVHQTDVETVNWNRLMTLGPEHAIGGLIRHEDRQRHPIFHAYRLYGMLPVQRAYFKTSDDHVDGFASVSDSCAGVLVWNSSEIAKTVHFDIKGLPASLAAAEPEIALYRIDRNHASIHEGSVSDQMDPTSGGVMKRSGSSFELELPGPGIICILIGEHDKRLNTLDQNMYVKHHRWCERQVISDRRAVASPNYGYYSPAEWTFHLGVQDKGMATAGVELKHVPSVLFADVKLSGYQEKEPSSDFQWGIKIDYLVDHKAVSAVVFGQERSVEENVPFYWGVKNPDHVKDALFSSSSSQCVRIEIDCYAPVEWKQSGQRHVIISPFINESMTGALCQMLIKVKDE